MHQASQFNYITDFQKCFKNLNRPWFLKGSKKKK